MSFEFGWDSAKAEENLKNHGVGFPEATAVFADPLARIFDDPDHSWDEKHEIIIGHSAKPRLLIVCFTERTGKIHLISARAATKRERQGYEQNAPKHQDKR